MTNMRTLLRRFRGEERGTIAVETILLLPILFWAYLSMFAIFDAYRQHSVNQKAAYTIGDIVSRQTTPIDAAYMDGTRKMVAYLTANDVEDVAIRVTSVRYDAKRKIYRRDWSQKKGWKAPLGGKDITALASRLPVMPHNDRIVIVETFVKYDPPFNTGLQEREIANFVFTRPRYAPRVLWSNG